MIATPAVSGEPRPGPGVIFDRHLTAAARVHRLAPTARFRGTAFFHAYVNGAQVPFQKLLHRGCESYYVGLGVAIHVRLSNCDGHGSARRAGPYRLHADYVSLTGAPLPLELKLTRSPRG